MIENILRTRLINLQITHKRHVSPENMVNDLMALQAQDYGQSMWALGSRLQKTSEARLEEAITNGGLVRSWLFRGTLHWMATADARWLTDLLAPTVKRIASSMNKVLGLDESTYLQSDEAMRQVLMLGEPLTREEIAEHLAAAGIRDPSGMRLSHLFYHAAMSQILCHGPRRGNTFTYVLFDRLVEQSKRKLSREEALGMLAMRYFQSHGPATEQDMAWWTGLPLGDVRTGLLHAKASLENVLYEGKTYWFDNKDGVWEKTTDQQVFLLAGFDEYLLGFKDRSLFLDASHQAEVCTKNGIFKPVVLVNGRVAGTWQRKVKKDRVEVQFNLFQALNAGQKEALQQELETYGRFCEKKVLSH